MSKVISSGDGSEILVRLLICSSFFCENGFFRMRQFVILTGEDDSHIVCISFFFSGAKQTPRRISSFVWRVMSK